MLACLILILKCSKQHMTACQMCKNLVKNFDQDKIEIAIDAVDNLSAPSADGSDDVEKMAKRAN